MSASLAEAMTGEVARLTPRDRIEGGILGSLVGDASGVPVEFSRTAAEPSAAPNGGPATQLGNSGATEGPPSLS